MIDELVKKPFYARRMRAGLVGPVMDDLAIWLAAHGYMPETIRPVLRRSRELSVWAKRRGLSLAQLDEGVLERFAARGGRARQSRAFRRQLHPTKLLLRFLRERGLAPSPAMEPQNTLPPLIAGFREWMQEHRGVQASTLDLYAPIVAALLTAARGTACGFSARQLRKFVLTRASGHGLYHAKTIVQASRMFIRYLVAEGHCPDTLVAAVPVIAYWKRSRLPRYLPPADIERVIASCDTSTVMGRRDRAIILLLARLGLRASDVRALTFDALDWSGGRLRVAGKNRRETWLPLPQDVGDAILAYLKDGRPASPAAQVFFTLRAPLKPLSRHCVAMLAGQAIRRAGVRTVSHGAHVFRHSAACSMLREGASLDEIGAVLRHASIETTHLYSKVDFDLLRTTVAPWPNVAVIADTDLRVTSLDLCAIAQSWPEGPEVV
jgi:integrase/recombinase XerD